MGEDELEEAKQILQDACDRDWKDETLYQTVNIAANGLYWRGKEIENLRRELAAKSAELATARDGALEEAATVCDAAEQDWLEACDEGAETPAYEDVVLRNAASVIRALKAAPAVQANATEYQHKPQHYPTADAQAAVDVAEVVKRLNDFAAAWNEPGMARINHLLLDAAALLSRRVEVGEEALKVARNLDADMPLAGPLSFTSPLAIRTVARELLRLDAELRGKP